LPSLQDQEHKMTDDRDRDQPSTDSAEESETHQDDWDPMTPETTLPASTSEYPASEEVPQEPEEETPA
jgi:hypothetical protein